MPPWLAFLEAWMVQQLLRTPAFHRVVEKVARGVHRVRHGVPPEELGGTKIDQPGQSGFLQHFAEEVKTQLGQVESKGGTGAQIERRGLDSHRAANKDTPNVQASEEGAEAAWQNARRNAVAEPRQGFLGAYASALREQIRGGKKT